MNPRLFNIKTVGVYVVVLLVVVRFIIIPLHNRLAEKKQLLTERQQLLKSKQSLLQKQTPGKDPHHEVVDRETVAKLFYPKDSPDTAIQADLVKNLIEVAEKKGLTVVNFEMLDVAREKELSEVAATLRLKGQPLGLVELLREVDNWPKPLRIKSFESARSGADYNISLTVAAFRIER